MDCIDVPESKIRLYDGNIVILKKFPDIKWVIHCGWYWYKNQQYSGWYFKSIPGGEILPTEPEDLEGIIVVSEEGCSPKFYPPYPPCPRDILAKFTKADYKELKSTFITVDNLKELNKISKKDVQDGRIVKVNDVEGQTKYFKFSKELQSWVPDDTLENIYTQIEYLMHFRCVWNSF